MTEESARPVPAPVAEGHAGSGPVRVLVVDDEPITAAAHAEYVRRISGFDVVGIARDGRQATRLLGGQGDLEAGAVDLVLLDMNLPDTHGLELCRRIRAAGLAVDVVAIPAVRDVAVVRAAVSLGIVQYLIKPFTYPAFAEKMRAYLAFRASFDDTAGLTTQSDVDHTLATLRAPLRAQPDKGLSQETLDHVVAALRERGAAQPAPGGPGGVSAAELAEVLHLSRVTARRYLEHLVDLGTVAREPRYGTPGRPELEYRWRA